MNLVEIARNNFRVADRTDVSGRVTAGLINDGSRAKRQSSLWRICSSAIFGCVVSVGVLACLAPMPVRAQGQGDPIVGSWIVHVTIDTIEIANPPLNPPPVLPIKFDNVAALTADGITADFSPPSDTLYGPWEKVAPRTYRQKIVTVSEGGGGVTAFTGPLVLNKQGDQISGPMRTIITDKNGQITLEYSGTLLFNRITFTSTP
jgi:hypothetical protein